MAYPQCRRLQCVLATIDLAPVSWQKYGAHALVKRTIVVRFMHDLSALVIS
jgi:hypothetical protein